MTVCPICKGSGLVCEFHPQKQWGEGCSCGAGMACGCRKAARIAELEAECERLRASAHEAPLNIYHLDADGHKWVEQVSSAWSDRSREWMEACNRLEAAKRAFE